MTADALNADYHVISQSGWGIISGWDGDPACSIPKYYDQVCGLTSKGKNALSGAGDEYDFASWQPDVIVVNLGTNDDSAFHQPAVFYDEDGHLFDQKVEEDGFYEKKSVQRLEKGIERFLKKIRRYNPNSYILWAYGMLGTPLESVIKEALNKYKIQNEDTKISFIELEAATSDTIGSREHPGYLCHRKAAEILIKEITNLMNS